MGDRLFLSVVFAAVLASVACTGGPSTAADFGHGPVDDADVVEPADVADTGADAPFTPTPDQGVDGGPIPTDAGPDLEVDLPEPLPELLLRSPAEPPTDLLQGTGVESCGVYLAETCSAGVRRQCEVYDAGAGEFVEPTPLLRRVLLYDRWYDLYHQPLGQTAERVYSRDMTAGTPESEWAADEAFSNYTGLGDAAIWNGAALLSAAMRYLQTGTEADYARMERKTRDLLLQFDVTQIPGYLARYHFLLVTPDAPQRQDVVLHDDPGALNHTYRKVEDPSTVPDLPAAYVDGFTEDDGVVWKGTPMWQGNPSIDQYSGLRAAFPLVHGLLLRDDGLQSRLTEHLVCYLNRLERIEIRNLQQNTEAVEAVTSFFGADTGRLNLDPGDPNLLETDTVVAYVLRQINTKNEATFDRSCPSGPQLTPTRVIDATADDFLVEVLKLATDLNSSSMEKPNGIDHVYVPSIRAADAVHMMQLATAAYHLTGDEQYRRFLFEELVGNIATLEVAKTTSAFEASRFCRAFFGAHISYTPTWGLLTMLADQPLRVAIEDVFRVDMWPKEMQQQWNAKFEILYVGEVEDDPVARSEAIAALHDLGGNGGVFDDPRRSYYLDPNFVAANLPDGNELVCPTVAEIEDCERDIEFQGLTIPGADVTHACFGQRPECPIGDECVRAQTRDPLPPSMRRYDDFMWQRNPYRVGSEEAVRDGARQSPGLDLTEEFWLARHYDIVDDGAGQALGWREIGTCP